MQILGGTLFEFRGIPISITERQKKKMRFYCHASKIELMERDVRRQ